MNGKKQKEDKRKNRMRIVVMEKETRNRQGIDKWQTKKKTKSSRKEIKRDKKR